MGLITQISKNTPKGASLCNHSLPDLSQARRQIGSVRGKSHSLQGLELGCEPGGAQEELRRASIPAREEGTPMFLFQGRELYF